jgi:hypothetical protein
MLPKGKTGQRSEQIKYFRRQFDYLPHAERNISIEKVVAEQKRGKPWDY